MPSCSLSLHDGVDNIILLIYGFYSLCGNLNAYYIYQALKFLRRDLERFNCGKLCILLCNVCWSIQVLGSQPQALDRFREHSLLTFFHLGPVSMWGLEKKAHAEILAPGAHGVDPEEADEWMLVHSPSLRTREQPDDRVGRRAERRGRRLHDDQAEPRAARPEPDERADDQDEFAADLARPPREREYDARRALLLEQHGPSPPHVDADDRPAREELQGEEDRRGPGWASAGVGGRGAALSLR